MARLARSRLPGTLVAILLATTARAAPPVVSKDDPATVQAKEMHRTGSKHFNLGEYDAALAAFKEAYRLREDPSFIFNIAQCYRFLRNHEEAARGYRTYLRQSPNAPNRTDVEELIKTEDAAAEEARKKAEADRQAEAARRELELKAAAAASQPAPESKRWYDDGAGWGLSAAGLAFIGVGIGLAAYESLLPVPKAGAADAIVKEYHSKQTVLWAIGGVLAGVGAGALTVGIVRFVKVGRRARATALLVPVEGGAMAGVAGEF